MPPIICIVGRSQTGKTTLIEKLIPLLKQRGFRIGTVKHSHHIFDFDKTGKDSWRHKDAGADTVLVSSPGKIALVKNDQQGTLDDLLTYFGDMDLVITEGFKKERKPKIEVVRAARHSDPLLTSDRHLVAVVSDTQIDVNVPKFGLDDIEKIAAFIEEKYLS
ncbi:MAG: molybdopterin-guanine dinucleotide biosynthesis protein B [Desulfobacterales bacterium]|jgi:molybdopterin-guanine dinucleotide biosynthesis protein B